ncbi:bifunctional DNA primase/polymerase [Sulfolobus sp. S-194]|uniref:bifunctional DNA primase/polymerase n=1 Tax=Sulfolobus sp. S-194 TaxID=2512240 RepID=UPI001436DB66|nr:bifunctional DNA primase/polymerase [Sulfolobus sp. S-194]QIW23997.1 bifunctional DNA primase/polymerase [Sulfolobus sp. S-194]
MVEKGYNYAVPGGQRVLIILDFEDKELVKAWIGEGELNKLCKSTLCVDAPHGGLHVYITADDIPEYKFNPVFIKDGKGIADLQSFNSYVVGPRSCINHRYCNADKCPWKGQDYTTCYIPN